MSTINQNQADETVLLCRTLSLLGYIAALFQDHRKPLSDRLQRIKEFAEAETKTNPCDDRENIDKAFCHEYRLFEVLSEERIPGHMDLASVILEADSGGYVGEESSSPTTFVNRKLIDELLYTVGSAPSFFGGDVDDEPQPLND